MKPIQIFLVLFALLTLVGCGDGQPTPTPLENAETVSSNTAKPEALKSPEKKQVKPEKSDPAPKGPPVTEAPRPLSDEQLADGWISLFDGATLYGWKNNNGANWQVENGAIVVSEGDVGLLTTTTRFANYELHLEFKRELGANSGVFLRTPKAPKAPDVDCYELNIADADNPFPTGSLVGRHKVEGDHHKQEWQTFDVAVDGDRVVVKLDGAEVLNYRDLKPLKSGHIGLQLNQGRVAFRSIRLKPLGAKSIFNGKDLEGWTAPESESVFTVTEAGELNVKNGRGYLETEKLYADFVLQLECISHASGLNSGIFFRCVPGSMMDGYESQIHNGFKNGDRRESVDHGTGGIFRRQKARLVVADDLVWFHKTIIADGDHMAVWVNGHQVSDWTDTRAPNENPRRGLRTEPGSIMIQGHDPTTDLSFRNLRIAETD